MGKCIGYKFSQINNKSIKHPLLEILKEISKSKGGILFYDKEG